MCNFVRLFKVLNKVLNHCATYCSKLRVYYVSKETWNAGLLKIWKNEQFQPTPEKKWKFLNFSILSECMHDVPFRVLLPNRIDFRRVVQLLRAPSKIYEFTWLGSDNTMFAWLVLSRTVPERFRINRATLTCTSNDWGAVYKNSRCRLYCQVMTVVRSIESWLLLQILVAMLSANQEIWNDVVKIARILLNAGARPDIRDVTGYTALRHACTNEHWKLVQLLLQHGADDTMPDFSGGLPVWECDYHILCVAWHKRFKLLSKLQHM